MWLRQSETTLALANLILAANLFHERPPSLDVPTNLFVSKESNMQSPPDQKDSRKSSPRIPEMVGATTAPFYIGPGMTQISIAMHPPSGPALLHEGSKQRQVVLHVENVTGEKRAPPFGVYLDLPPGDEPQQHPDLRAGSLGLFGLVEASNPAGEHGGNGMTFSMDVTAVFTRLMAMKDWDPHNLRVFFIAGSWDAPVPRVRIGR